MADEFIVRPEVAVIIEKGATAWGAYVLSVPGCFAVAPSRDEVQRKIGSALTFHRRHLQAEAMQSAADEAVGTIQAARR